MCEEDERDIEDVIGQEEDYKKVDGKGELADRTIGSFYIEKLLKPSLVDDHFSDVLVLILESDVQSQSVAVVLDITITPPHQQLFHYSAVSAHYSQMKGSHPIGEILLV